MAKEAAVGDPAGKEGMFDTASLEQALASGDPVESLRGIAVAWSRAGLGRRRIYEIFLELHTRLQDEGRTRDEDVLGDVMDMIMDAYPPRNLNLPP